MNTKVSNQPPRPGGSRRRGWGRALAAAGLMSALPLAAYAAPPAAGCTVQANNYRGWKAEELANRWVKLEIVPQLGGRLMQVTFNGHDFLFVNKQLAGQVLPPDTVHHAWRNYGGDKIWPMPEGSKDERHWAGAGGEPLDDEAFALKVMDAGQDGRCAVQLTGPVDPQIGQRYIRNISIGSNTPAIAFHATMVNVSGYPQSWSEQSVSQYNAADPNNDSTFNPQFFGLVPANPQSQYLLGYHVRTGQAANRAYSVANGLFRLHWGADGGEVWTDTTGGWVAIVDGSTNYTMIERYAYKPEAHYPGKSTVLFFTTGDHSNRPRPAGAPERPPIFYMEAEVNSPVVQLDPGQSYTMDTTWYPTRMGSNFTTADWGGVVGQPLAAKATPQGLQLSGAFGVFFPGQLVAHFYSMGGEAIGTANIGVANPNQPLNLNTSVQAPAETARVSLHVVDAKGLDRGPLGEAFVNPPPPPPPHRGGY